MTASGEAPHDTAALGKAPLGNHRPLTRRLLSRSAVAAAAALMMLPLAGPLAPARAASFDCAKAALPDEIAICANRDLDDADVEMATRYDMVLQLLAMGAAGDLRDSQKAWLAQRTACGSNLACLRGSYRSRIAALKATFAPIVAMGPF